MSGNRMERLEAAINEAERFIARGKELLNRRESGMHSWETPVENGACKRASMDLTRALSAYRSGTE